MIGRLFEWIWATRREDLDERRRWAARQHERAARRAVVTGVDTTMGCDDAKDAMEKLLERMEGGNAGRAGDS